MLPLRLAFVLEVAFKAQAVIIFHRFYYGVLIQRLRKFPSVAFFRQQIAQVFRQFLITAVFRKFSLFRPCSCQINIGIRLKINHRETGKHCIYPFDNISHFPVFFLQQFSVPSCPEKHKNNINDK